MAKKEVAREGAVEILQDILIVQLGLAGVPQQTIRRIVGCNMSRVTEIVRHLGSKNDRKAG